MVVGSVVLLIAAGGATAMAVPSATHLRGPRDLIHRHRSGELPTPTRHR